MGTRLQYGPDAADPAEAAGLLSAVSELNGVQTRRASEIDQVAAAYAAEQWCLAHRTKTLEFPRVHGIAAVESLAAIMSRASGRRTTKRGDVTAIPQDATWDEMTSGLSQDQKIECIQRVVDDLRYGGSEVLQDWVTLRLGLATAGASGNTAI